jgi:hypothetical protein
MAHNSVYKIYNIMNLCVIIISWINGVMFWVVTKLTDESNDDDIDYGFKMGYMWCR